MSNRMPHLSKPQLVVLAMWSYGIALIKSCGRRSVAVFLAMLLGKNEDAIEQRLQEWCCDAQDKSGKKRRTLDVTSCFMPLLAWIVALWTGTCLALAVDATSLGDRFVVLTVSVVYRGTGIPVAWTVLAGQQKEAWRYHWLRMLRQVHRAIPRTWTVLVLADRGLYAAWLFRRIRRLEWHPFLRINSGAKFRPAGKAGWYWLRELVPEVGARWRGCGTAFRSPGCHLECTLVAWWGEGHDEPWFILTDLPADGCDAAWYGLRTWCEQGFKCTKRAGWQWQQTRMTDPDRAARLWLPLAIAMLWTVTLGSELETGPTEEIADVPDLSSILAATIRTGRRRRIRLFRLGWLWLLVRLVTAQPLPLPRQLVPEPWPEIPEEWNTFLMHQKALSHVTA
ncbi:MAG TPA: transposase [Anaerolineae bacterium]|nr:transposase [Anaerolineae bacterium]